jgi:hypothetical protein
MNPDTIVQVVALIEGEFYTCTNIEDGKCATWWRHPECEITRQILFAITKNRSYLREREELWMEFLRADL